MKKIAVAARVHEALMLADVLSDEEIVRSRQFLFHRDRNSYVAAHLLVRHMIGSWMNLDPKCLKFYRDTFGKPILVGDAAPHFNLSHCGDWVAVGLSRETCIGVDVEADQSPDAWRECEALFLAESEKRAGTPPPYLEVWTAKEAALKAHGAGLSIVPNSIPISFKDNLFRVEIEGRTFSGRSVELDERHVLSVASLGELSIITVCRSGRAVAEILECLQFGGGRKDIWAGASVGPHRSN